MKYLEAKNKCDNKSGIYREKDSSKTFTEENLKEMPAIMTPIYKHKVNKPIPKIYWYNTAMSFDNRIPDKDKKFNDWKIFNPKSDNIKSLLI